MPFDPTKPAFHSANSSAEMRAQLQALHDEIAAVPTVSTVVIDAVNPLPPGSLPTVTSFLNGEELHFAFGLVAGTDGAQGPPGEVSQSQLNQEIAAAQTNIQNAVLPQTSSNSNIVASLNMTVSDPPTQAEMQALANKLDELISALRR